MVFKFEPHGLWLTGIYKTYCQNCGLVRLNNDFTNWAIKTDVTIETIRIMNRLDLGGQNHDGNI